jgi:phosphoribosylformylglycinamidine (FGAM) synthase-like enzyme
MAMAATALRIPAKGAKLMVAEAARNVVCVGRAADRDYQLPEFRFA